MFTPHIYPAMTYLDDPSTKYKPFPQINLPNRQWPSKTLDKPPRWLSTDLRDGNQSLPDPMTMEEKKEYFKKIVDIGYKEIEVAFPSASQVDFDFTRFACDTAPEDVWIQVLAPCREDLITRTVDSVKGAHKAIIHIYLATSKCFRDIVFNHSREEALAKAVACAKHVRALTKDSDDPECKKTTWGFEFSPETFSDTDMDYAVEVCEAVKAAWEPTEDNPIIFNLPATVEMATPNIYADQIEYFATHISEREKICISLHPHNDRGCAVAAAELGQMAGADRVEGCLFGNGERTGNVDLVTLGLNLYTQGVHPKIDFSDITSIIDIVERCNKIPVHPRAPYGGQLVVCAFSGSHQDAIKKGFARIENVKDEVAEGKKQWQIPYLPLDPKDIGRTYEAVIRVNSQSGKGGAAWIILRSLELDLPRGLQVAFSKVVQKEAEVVGQELSAQQLVDLFEREYGVFEEQQGKYQLVDFEVTNKSKEERELAGALTVEGKRVELKGTGNGPISSFLDSIKNAFGYNLEVLNYHEHSIGKGSKTKAATYIELAYEENGKTAKRWGVGIDEDVSQASIHAILSAMNAISEAYNKKE